VEVFKLSTCLGKNRESEYLHLKNGGNTMLWCIYVTQETPKGTVQTTKSLQPSWGYRYFTNGLLDCDKNLEQSPNTFWVAAEGDEQGS
jgi:hypothetical protein